MIDGRKGDFEANSKPDSLSFSVATLIFASQRVAKIYALPTPPASLSLPCLPYHADSG